MRTNTWMRLNCGDRTLTYQEFSVLVGRLASRFAGTCEVRGPRILIALPHDPEAFASMFAALAVGGEYLPINLDWPRLRIQQIAAQYDPTLILADAPLSGGFPHVTGSRVLLLSADLPETLLSTPRPAGTVACTLFTSGFTGNPKGVVIGRRGLGRYLDWLTPALDLGPGKRCSQHPNLAFDAERDGSLWVVMHWGCARSLHQCP